MDYTVEESGATTRVILTGDLAITDGQRLKEMLEGVLKEKDRISVNLDDVSDIDITALQIFCAAHRSSIRFNKEFLRDGNLSETVNKAVVIAGFKREKACSQAGDGPCLWRIMEEL